MSDSSDEDDQRKAESTSRMWAESQPGPSRSQPSRQGYCGYCRVLYSNLDQHLSSLKHLDSVRASSRGSSTVSSASSSRTKLTLLERFLQDVLQHHPHRYKDLRPSHADLPSVSAPPLPRAELDDLQFSDDDSRSLGTREHLPSSDEASCPPDKERLSAPIRAQEDEGPPPTEHTHLPHTQTPPPHTQAPPIHTETPPTHMQAPPPVHRKAHRKTNRRKTSESLSSSPPHRAPDPSDLGPHPNLGTKYTSDLSAHSDPKTRALPDLRPHLEHGTKAPSKLKTHPDPGARAPSDLRPRLDPGTRAPSDLRPHIDIGPQGLSDLRPRLDPGTRAPSDLRPRLDPGTRAPSDLRPHIDIGPQGLSDLRPRLDPGARAPSDLRPRLDPGTRAPSDLRPHIDIGPQGLSDLRPRLDPGTRAPSDLKPRLDPGTRAPSDLKPHLDPGTSAPSDPRPWLSWQKERREAHKEEAFSSDHSDPVDQTIEEVIQMCCHGVGPASRQQEETESFHFSLPVSMETQSDDWDSPAQRDALPSHSPVQVSQRNEQDLSRLMDVQVDLQDQVYSYQLDSALHREERAEGGGRPEEGFWTLPIEEVLPAPAHIPESFRGKTWTQIEQEDEERVEKLVRQFRRNRFICYFDSESLARYGRRSQNKMSRNENQEVEPDGGVLPLLDCDEDDSAYVRRRRRRRSFRVASRCQVVKVSHSTQTVRLVVPAVCQPAVEAPPTSLPAANQEAAEKTPDVQKWRCLPPLYSNIVTPLQPRTSLVYLLCSPSSPAPTCTPAAGPRCRRKRRPLDLQGLKVKYKQLPVRFYDPSSNRILNNPPRRGSALSSLPPPCVRQLFRSLSPDLNADRPLAESASGSRSKGSRSSDSFSFLHRTRGSTSQAPPPSPHSRGRGGRRDRTRPSPSKRRTRAQTTPLQPRREGLRRAGLGSKVPGSTGLLELPQPRRGRSRRGRGCDRGRR